MRLIAFAFFCMPTHLRRVCTRVVTSDVLSGAHPLLRSDSDYCSTSSARSRCRPELSGVVRSCPELSGVVWSRKKSESPQVGVVGYRPESRGVVRSPSESPGVVWSCSELSRVDQNRSHSESVQCACDQAFHFVVLFCLSLCACTSYTGLCFEGLLRISGYSGRLRANLDDSRRFRTDPGVTERFRINETRTHTHTQTGCCCYVAPVG